MSWGWKVGLIVSFLVFYVGFGLLAWGWDLSHGKASMSDFWGYVTFGKFVDYSQGFNKRAVDFFNADTGALKADAALSMFLLGVAQLSFILLLATIAWVIVPSDKKIAFLLVFLLAFAFVSALHYWYTGDPVIGILKVFQYALSGAPHSLPASDLNGLVTAGGDANA